MKNLQINKKQNIEKNLFVDFTRSFIYVIKNRFNQKSTHIIEKVFFSSFTIILTNIQKITYNQNLKLKNIQFYEITKIIIIQIFSKISKNNDIINRILKWINNIIFSHLQRIFNVNIKTKYCSKHFRKSIIIVFRKSQKKIYSFATSYKSITLFNIINKIMKFILIKRINYLTKTYDLLSRTYFEIKKNTFTKHVLHYMIKRIHSIWNKNKINVIMFFDVMKTFDNITRQKLLYNLKMKRLNEKLIRWINFYLNNKMTILKIDEYDIEWFEIFVNISQNSFMSSILFLFYNVSLLKKLKRRNIFANDFVDDVKLMIDNNIIEKCNEMIVKIYEKICVS